MEKYQANERFYKKNIEGFSSNDEFEANERVHFTNEIPPIDLYDLAHSELKNDYWKWFLGSSSVMHDVEYNLKTDAVETTDKDGYIEDFSTAKYVNGFRSKNFGPRPVKVWNSKTKSYDIVNKETGIRYEVSGALMPEFDLLLHECYRYLSHLYPNHQDWRYLLTDNEIDDEFKSNAFLINYNLNTQFMDWLSLHLGIDSQEAIENEAFNLKLRNLLHDAYRRKLFSGKHGYKMIGSDIFYDVSVYPGIELLPVKNVSTKATKTTGEKVDEKWHVEYEQQPEKLSLSEVDKQHPLYGLKTRLVDWENESYEYDKRHRVPPSFYGTAYPTPEKPFILYEYPLEREDTDVTKTYLSMHDEFETGDDIKLNGQASEWDKYETARIMDIEQIPSYWGYLGSEFILKTNTVGVTKITIDNEFDPLTRKAKFTPNFKNYLSAQKDVIAKMIEDECSVDEIKSAVFEGLKSGDSEETKVENIKYMMSVLFNDDGTYKHSKYAETFVKLFGEKELPNGFFGESDISIDPFQNGCFFASTNATLKMYNHDFIWSDDEEKLYLNKNKYQYIVELDDATLYAGALSNGFIQFKNDKTDRLSKEDIEKIKRINESEDNGFVGAVVKFSSQSTSADKKAVIYGTAQFGEEEKVKETWFFPSMYLNIKSIPKTKDVPLMDKLYSNFEELCIKKCDAIVSLVGNKNTKCEDFNKFREFRDFEKEFSAALDEYLKERKYNKFKPNSESFKVLFSAINRMRKNIQELSKPIVYDYEFNELLDEETVEKYSYTLNLLNNEVYEESRLNDLTEIANILIRKLTKLYVVYAKYTATRKDKDLYSEFTERDANPDVSLAVSIILGIDKELRESMMPNAAFFMDPLPLDLLEPYNSMAKRCSLMEDFDEISEIVTVEKTNVIEKELFKVFGTLKNTLIYNSNAFSMGSLACLSRTHNGKDWSTGNDIEEFIKKSAIKTKVLNAEKSFYYTTAIEPTEEKDEWEFEEAQSLNELLQLHQDKVSSRYWTYSLPEFLESFLSDESKNNIRKDEQLLYDVCINCVASKNSNVLIFTDETSKRKLSLLSTGDLIVGKGIQSDTRVLSIDRENFELAMSKQSGVDNSDEYVFKCKQILDAKEEDIYDYRERLSRSKNAVVESSVGSSDFQNQVLQGFVSVDAYAKHILRENRTYQKQTDLFNKIVSDLYKGSIKSPAIVADSDVVYVEVNAKDEPTSEYLFRHEVLDYFASYKDRVSNMSEDTHFGVCVNFDIDIKHGIPSYIELYDSNDKAVLKRCLSEHEVRNLKGKGFIQTAVEKESVENFVFLAETFKNIDLQHNFIQPGSLSFTFEVGSTIIELENGNKKSTSGKTFSLDEKNKKILLDGEVVKLEDNKFFKDLIGLYSQTSTMYLKNTEYIKLEKIDDLNFKSAGLTLEDEILSAEKIKVRNSEDSVKAFSKTYSIEGEAIGVKDGKVVLSYKLEEEPYLSLNRLKFENALSDLYPKDFSVDAEYQSLTTHLDTKFFEYNKKSEKYFKNLLVFEADVEKDIVMPSNNAVLSKLTVDDTIEDIFILDSEESAISYNKVKDEQDLLYFDTAGSYSLFVTKNIMYLQTGKTTLNNTNIQGLNFLSAVFVNDEDAWYVFFENCTYKIGSTIGSILLDVNESLRTDDGYSAFKVEEDGQQKYILRRDVLYCDEDGKDTTKKLNFETGTRSVDLSGSTNFVSFEGYFEFNGLEEFTLKSNKTFELWIFSQRDNRWVRNSASDNVIFRNDLLAGKKNFNFVVGTYKGVDYEDDYYNVDDSADIGSQTWNIPEPQNKDFENIYVYTPDQEFTFTITSKTGKAVYTSEAAHDSSIQNFADVTPDFFLAGENILSCASEEGIPVVYDKDSNTLYSKTPVNYYNYIDDRFDISDTNGKTPYRYWKKANLPSKKEFLVKVFKTLGFKELQALVLSFLEKVTSSGTSEYIELIKQKVQMLSVESILDFSKLNNAGERNFIEMPYELKYVAGSEVASFKKSDGEPLTTTYSVPIFSSFDDTTNNSIQKELNKQMVYDIFIDILFYVCGLESDESLDIKDIKFVQSKLLLISDSFIYSLDIKNLSSRKMTEDIVYWEIFAESLSPSSSTDLIKNHVLVDESLQVIDKLALISDFKIDKVISEGSISFVVVEKNSSLSFYTSFSGDANFVKQESLSVDNVSTFNLFYEGDNFIVEANNLKYIIQIENNTVIFSTDQKTSFDTFDFTYLKANGYYMMFNSTSAYLLGFTNAGSLSNCKVLSINEDTFTVSESTITGKVLLAIKTKQHIYEQNKYFTFESKYYSSDLSFPVRISTEVDSSLDAELIYFENETVDTMDCLKTNPENVYEFDENGIVAVLNDEGIQLKYSNAEGCPLYEMNTTKAFERESIFMQSFNFFSLYSAFKPISEDEFIQSKTILNKFEVLSEDSIKISGDYDDNFEFLVVSDFENLPVSEVLSREIEHVTKVGLYIHELNRIKSIFGRKLSNYTIDKDGFIYFDGVKLFSSRKRVVTTFRLDYEPKIGFKVFENFNFSFAEDDEGLEIVENGFAFINDKSNCTIDGIFIPSSSYGYDIKTGNEDVLPWENDPQAFEESIYVKNSYGNIVTLSDENGLSKNVNILKPKYRNTKDLIENEGKVIFLNDFVQLSLDNFEYLSPEKDYALVNKESGFDKDQLYFVRVKSTSKSTLNTTEANNSRYTIEIPYSETEKFGYDRVYINPKVIGNAPVILDEVKYFEENEKDYSSSYWTSTNSKVYLCDESGKLLKYKVENGQCKFEVIGLENGDCSTEIYVDHDVRVQTRKPFFVSSYEKFKRTFIDEGIFNPLNTYAKVSQSLKDSEILTNVKLSSNDLGIKSFSVDEIDYKNGKVSFNLEDSDLKSKNFYGLSVEKDTAHKARGKLSFIYNTTGDFFNEEDIKKYVKITKFKIFDKDDNLLFEKSHKPIEYDSTKFHISYNLRNSEEFKC